MRRLRVSHQADYPIIFDAEPADTFERGKRYAAELGVRTRWAAVAGRFPRGERGQSLVEFAFVTFLLFLLVFAVIDFGRLFFVQMTLQHAVREAGRFAVTGNKLQDPNNPGQFLTRVNSIKEVARRSAAGLDVSAIDVSSASGSGSAGGPDQSVTISLTHSLKFATPLIRVFFPNGQYVFTVRTTFRNEPFPAAQTV